VAAEWARTEEIQEAQWETDQVHQRLVDTQAFARTAVAAGKPVHLWTSL